MRIIRSVSYGGGVQSTALLVLAAQRRIDFPLFIMANVGDDSEHPATLAYVEHIAKPYAAEHDIELVTVQKRDRAGNPVTLYDRLTRPGSMSTGIPHRSRKDGPPLSRSCTVSFKAEVIVKELKRRGATREHPATVGLGISLDEIHRANTKRATDYERLVYPLIGFGEETGLKMTRDDCARVIREAGIPVPPKSSCYFCPFHRDTAWADLARETPDLFEKAAQLEEHLDARQRAAGKRPVYLTRHGIPLRAAIDTDQELLPLVDDGGCDSGWCMT